MADLDRLRQESVKYLNKNSYYKGLNSKNAQNLAIVDSYISDTQSIFAEYKQQCQDLKFDMQDAYEDYEAALCNYNYSLTDEAKELMDAAKDSYIMISQKSAECEAEKVKIESEVLSLRNQKDVIVEDKKVTEEEIEWTGVQLEKIEAEIKQAEEEIKKLGQEIDQLGKNSTKSDKDYSNNASGSCQKGIDTIFNLDNSKNNKESTTVKKSSSYDMSNFQLTSQQVSQESRPDKKSNGMWWSASRDFDL